MRFLFLVLVFQVSLVCKVKAQSVNIPVLEREIKSAIRTAYDASVRIWGFDTVRKVQNSSQFSGVVVDKDGTILTVAHAIRSNQAYKVRFPNGQEFIARSLGRMGRPDNSMRPDVGMLQIQTSGDWPVAEMGWSNSLKVDQPCISISYPETLNQLLPTVRFGRITSTSNTWGFMESTCKMEPGDSGGPLFDCMGRVIGLHSRCLDDEDGNLEVPIDTYRKYWSALKIAHDYVELPTDTIAVGKDPLEAKIVTLHFLKTLSEVIPRLPVDLNDAVVGLRSKAVGGEEQNILATVFEVKGRTYLVSKSSMVGDDVRLDNDKSAVLAVIARDENLDLALLSMTSQHFPRLSLDVLDGKAGLSSNDLGTILTSPFIDENRVSIVSSMYLDLPRRFSAGFLGAGSSIQEGKIKITRVSTGGPAEIAGLKPGDEVLQINGAAVGSAQEYNDQIKRYNPGDDVIFSGIREGQPFSLTVKLSKHSPANHPAERFEGGKSTRLDGFDAVFTHDAVIRPNECGGPVFDTKGQFYGINIARFSRTSTLVMSPIRIKQFIEKNLNPLKS